MDKLQDKVVVAMVELNHTDVPRLKFAMVDRLTSVHFA